MRFNFCHNVLDFKRTNDVKSNTCDEKFDLYGFLACQSHRVSVSKGTRCLQIRSYTTILRW